MSGSEAHRITLHIVSPVLIKSLMRLHIQLSLGMEPRRETQSTSSLDVIRFLEKVVLCMKRTFRQELASEGGHTPAEKIP